MSPLLETVRYRSGQTGPDLHKFSALKVKELNTNVLHRFQTDFKTHFPLHLSVPAANVKRWNPFWTTS